MEIYHSIIDVIYFHHKYMIVIIVVLHSSGYRKEKEMGHIPKSTWPKDILHMGGFC